MASRMGRLPARKIPSAFRVLREPPAPGGRSSGKTGLTLRCRFFKRLNLAFGESAFFTRRQIFKHQRPVLLPVKIQYGKADRMKHVPDLALVTLVNRNFNPAFFAAGF